MYQQHTYCRPGHSGLVGFGHDKREIIEDFPELTIEHIWAALAFAADSERRTRLIAA